MRTLLRNPLVLVTAFVLVHLWLGLVNLTASSIPLGDVSTVYRSWADQAIANHQVVGIDTAWVYPIVALLPMLLSYAFGPELYSISWLILVVLMDAFALSFIVGRSRDWQQKTWTRIIAGWWWLGFIVLLGPIAIGRIDAISVPIAIVGLLSVAKRPRVALILLTIATWIKVWPAAIIAATIISVHRRVNLSVAVAGTSGVIVAVAVLLGGQGHIFSFITQQTTRGLQIEAPITTLWLWRAFAGEPRTGIFLDRGLLTWQVRGDGVSAASAVMTAVLAVAILAITVFGIWVTSQSSRVAGVLPLLSLAYVSAFIIFNKVGSPQYISWLAVPVIFGLVTAGTCGVTSFRVPTILVSVLAALTQLIYPYLYFMLLDLNVLMLVVVSARNILLVVLFGWAIHSLWRANTKINRSTLAEAPRLNAR